MNLKPIKKRPCASFASVAVLLNRNAASRMTERERKAFAELFKEPVEPDGGDLLYYRPYGCWMEGTDKVDTVMNFLHSLDAEEGEQVEMCIAYDISHMECWDNYLKEDERGRLDIRPCIHVDGNEAESYVCTDEEG